MVIADADSPGPVRKRPRLSLKAKRSRPVNPEDKSSYTSCKRVVISSEEEIQKEKESDEEMKIKESKIVPAVSSLENLGNTCFLNSILQVLRYTPGFMTGLAALYQDIIFLEKFRKQEAKDIKEEEVQDSSLTWFLVKHLFKFYKNMERQEENHYRLASDDVMSMALKPNKILSIIRELNPMFEGNLQHDAQEVLRCILSYLQDASKEIRKAKNLLPPSLCPTHSKGPVNPIMQKFLNISSKSEKGSESEKLGNGVYCAAQTENGMDFLDHIEKSEAAKTVTQESSQDPKEADVPDSEMLSQSNPDIGKGEGSQVRCTKIVTDDNVKKRSRTNKRKSETDTPVPMITESSSAPENEEEPRKSKRTRKITEKVQLMIQAKNDKKAEKGQVKGHDLLQPSILSMLGSSNKRLGMRGAVVRKNETSNGCHGNESDNIMDIDSTIEVKSQTFSNASKNSRLAMYGITGEKISPKKTFGGVSPRKALRSPSPVTTVQISPRKDNTTHKEMSSLMAVKNNDDPHSPVKLSSDFKNLNCHEQDNLDLQSKKGRQPVIKLEKCDRVCDSPKKSVSAGYAEKTLSPFKTTTNLSQRSALAKQRLDFCVKEPKTESICSNQQKIGKSGSQKEENLSQIVENKTPKKDFVETLFMGSMMLRTKCLECEFSRERSEEFHDISVPVKIEKYDEDDENSMDSVSENSNCLSRLMEAFTEAERLCDNNKYYCDKCIRHVEAERSLHYEVLPDILTVHLKRFSSSTGLYGYISKINDHVTIPLWLPCLRYKCPSPCSRADHRYRLYALVTHAGMTLTSGHYLSYVRVMDSDGHSDQADSETQSDASMTTTINSDNKCFESSINDFLCVPRRKYLGKWLECDDESIRVHSEDSFCSMLEGVDGALLGTPYVLFYHRLKQEDHC